jgi:Zn-dependent protease with chaperone function
VSSSVRSRSASKSAGSLRAQPSGGARGVRARSGGALLLALAAALVAGACASAPAKVAPRAATDDDRRVIGRALAPLLRAAGLFKGPGNGCDAALGVLPTPAINVGVGAHPSCTIALLVTEGALTALPYEELMAALAHELGHAQLGHFAARRDRRVAERDAKQKIEERGTTAGAAVTAVPVIGPLLAVAVIGSQAAAQTATESAYRGYDQAEETAADRYAVDLLNSLQGGSRCHALAALLERLDGARSGPPWRDWLSTHPSPGLRLEAVKGACP